MAELIQLSNAEDGTPIIALPTQAGVMTVLHALLRAKFETPFRDIFLFNSEINKIIVELTNVANINYNVDRHGEIPLQKYQEILEYIEVYIADNSDWDIRNRKELIKEAIVPWLEPNLPEKDLVS